MDSFTITISSSDTSFSENTLARFRTCLPKELSLGGKWTVGLAEFHYTKSWFNIQRDEFVHIFDNEGGITKSPTPVMAGYYESKDLLHAISESVADCCKNIEQSPVHSLTTRSKSKQNEQLVITPPTITFNDISRRVELKPGSSNNDKREFYISISFDLQDMLGLSNRSKFYRVDDYSDEFVDVLEKSIKGDAFAIKCYDLNYGIHSLFVYCNIVEPTIVGNTYAQLLRTVPIANRKFGEQCHQVYSKPYFYPLLSNNLQIIQVDIRDKSGHLIPFRFGETTIVLEFKRLR